MPNANSGSGGGWRRSTTAMLKLTAAQRAAAQVTVNVRIAWNDLVLGRREVKLPAISEPVLVRADGTRLRTFTSVVDDIEAGITHPRSRRRPSHPHGPADGYFSRACASLDRLAAKFELLPHAMFGSVVRTSGNCWR